MVNKKEIEEDDPEDDSTKEEKYMGVTSKKRKRMKRMNTKHINVLENTMNL